MPFTFTHAVRFGINSMLVEADPVDGGPTRRQLCTFLAAPSEIAAGARTLTTGIAPGTRLGTEVPSVGIRAGHFEVVGTFGAP